MSRSFALGFACSLLCTRIHTVIGFDEHGPSCRALRLGLPRHLNDPCSRRSRTSLKFLLNGVCTDHITHGPFTGFPFFFLALNNFHHRPVDLNKNYLTSRHLISNRAR